MHHGVCSLTCNLVKGLAMTAGSGICHDVLAHARWCLWHVLVKCQAQEGASLRGTSARPREPVSKDGPRLSRTPTNQTYQVVCLVLDTHRLVKLQSQNKESHPRVCFKDLFLLRDRLFPPEKLVIFLYKATGMTWVRVSACFLC